MTYKVALAVLKTMNLLIKTLRPKDNIFEVEVKYSAEDTISVTCRQASGVQVNTLYWRLTIYSPFKREVLLTRTDAFGEFGSSRNKKVLTREAFDDERKWLTIKEVVNFKPSNKPLPLPWIFEYSIIEIKRFSYQYIKSKELTFYYLLRHYGAAMKEQQ